MLEATYLFIKYGLAGRINLLLIDVGLQVAEPMHTLRRHFLMTYYFDGQKDCGKRSVVRTIDEATHSVLRAIFLR